jgi:hypothetical protein
VTKRTVEIEDTLQERVEEAIEAIGTLLLDYLKENPDTDELPDLHNDLDYSGAVHETIDGEVPIYTSEIDDTMYLHSGKVEEAFDNAGIGEKQDGSCWPMGWKAAAIYCYIEQEVQEWYRKNAQEMFEKWQEAKEDGE